MVVLSLGVFLLKLSRCMHASHYTLLEKETNVPPRAPSLDLTPPHLISLQEVYTVWDCLTASLCAIMSDNLPLELLNNPLHISPDLIPFADASPVVGVGTGNSAGVSSSPAWLERPGGSAVAVAHVVSEEVCDSVETRWCLVKSVSRSLGVQIP